MKQTFLSKAEVVRHLGIFAIVCFAIVSWVGGRACVAFFQEAIYHSLREWLLLGNRPARMRLGQELSRADILDQKLLLGGNEPVKSASQTSQHASGLNRKQFLRDSEVEMR